MNPMKKNIFSILAVAAALSATSCSWLDITPEDTVIEEELFSEAEGFHNAINGLYNTMADGALYGRELSYGFVEVLSQNYLGGDPYNYASGLSRNSVYYPLFKYDYTGTEGVKQIIENIWSKAYFVIANANNIIKNVESLTPDKFRYGQEEKNMIKGEALAVRAMMHFDMLRLFAPAPAVADNAPYIPYLEDFPYYGGQAKETVESIMTKVVRDLQEAKELIKSYDTMDSEKMSKLSDFGRFSLSIGGSNADAFYEYRGYRINIMAVTALLARAYNYRGKHSEAFAEAKEAADFIYDKDRALKALNYSTQVEFDRKFSPDLIFCLSDALMSENYQTYSVSTSNDFLNMDANVVKFENAPEADGGDTRFRFLVERNDKWGDVGYRPLKYLKSDVDNEVAKRVADMLPVIRLSEMHFIMAEAKANEGNFSVTDGANYYLNLIREGRNCKKMDLGIATMDDFKKQLFMEVRKEYFNEGHTFYYFKKYNELLTNKMQPESFVIPTPDSEEIN